jgi:hypothetical protein
MKMNKKNEFIKKEFDLMKREENAPVYVKKR